MSVLNVSQLQDLMERTKGGYVDSTNMIREFKHSRSMLSEIVNLRAIRQIYSDPVELRSQSFECAPFLANHFQSIFMRIVKGDLDLDILEKAVYILKDIEEGKFNQEEGAKKFSAMMLELYAQGIVKKEVETPPELTKSNDTTAPAPAPATFSWKDWKSQK
jgi:hypothetical protein